MILGSNSYKMPLTELRCKGDYQPKLIVKIFFNSKCEIERQRSRERQSDTLSRKAATNTCSCGIPPALMEVPLLSSPSHGYPRGVRAVPTAWQGTCVSSCFLYHSLPLWEFLSGCYPDLPHQAWHLPGDTSALSPQSAQRNLVWCANSKPLAFV